MDATITAEEKAEMTTALTELEQIKRTYGELPSLQKFWTTVDHGFEALKVEYPDVFANVIGHSV